MTSPVLSISHPSQMIFWVGLASRFHNLLKILIFRLLLEILQNQGGKSKKIRLHHNTRLFIRFRTTLRSCQTSSLVMAVLQNFIKLEYIFQIIILVALFNQYPKELKMCQSKLGNGMGIISVGWEQIGIELDVDPFSNLIFADEMRWRRQQFSFVSRSNSYLLIAKCMKYFSLHTIGACVAHIDSWKHF